MNRFVLLLGAAANLAACSSSPSGDGEASRTVVVLPTPAASESPPATADDLLRERMRALSSLPADERAHASAIPPPAAAPLDCEGGRSQGRR